MRTRRQQRPPLRRNRGLVVLLGEGAGDTGSTSTPTTTTSSPSPAAIADGRGRSSPAPESMTAPTPARSRRPSPPDSDGAASTRPPRRRGLVRHQAVRERAGRRRHEFGSSAVTTEEHDGRHDHENGRSAPASPSGGGEASRDRAHEALRADGDGRSSFGEDRWCAPCFGNCAGRVRRCARRSLIARRGDGQHRTT
jgi:hypothetical protein